MLKTAANRVLRLILFAVAPSIGSVAKLTGKSERALRK
jgi:hypothetical protein